MGNKRKISISAIFLVIFIFIILILSFMIYRLYEQKNSLEEKNVSYELLLKNQSKPEEEIISSESTSKTTLKQELDNYTQYQNNYTNTLTSLYKENARVYLEIPMDSETYAMLRNISCNY